MEWQESATGVRWLHADLGSAQVAFPARAGGVSAPPYAELNLGTATGDEREAVSENRDRLARALGLDPGRIVSSRQVHGDRILGHEQPGPGSWAEAAPEREEADAHTTSIGGIPLAVLTADCLAVAVRGRGGLGLAHCGWRGLASGLLARLAESVDAVDAAIGPGIGPCCYEVGLEVSELFAGTPGAVAGRQLDLPAVARAQLEASGASVVDEAALCTYCSEETFFSHRRDGPRSGRGGAIAWLT